MIYTGKDIPKQAVKITMDKEIKSVFHNEKYIGLILKNQGKSGYELRLYNKTGKVVLSKEFTGDYNHVKLCDDQVIMYDGKTCSIFMKMVYRSSKAGWIITYRKYSRLEG